PPSVESSSLTPSHGQPLLVCEDWQPQYGLKGITASNFFAGTWGQQLSPVSFRSPAFNIRERADPRGAAGSAPQARMPLWGAARTSTRGQAGPHAGLARAMGDSLELPGQAKPSPLPGCGS